MLLSGAYNLIMSNRNLKYFFLILIFLATTVITFNIEIINTGRNNNPFGNIFGPPDNLMNDILNDIEKDLKIPQDNQRFPVPIFKKPRMKDPRHKHKEIIEINGPGFKSVEIREVFSPDEKKSLRSTDSLFNHQIERNTNEEKFENFVEKAIEEMNEFEKDVQDSQKKPLDPFDNFVKNLFSPPQHHPVIFVNHKKNLKGLESDHHKRDEAILAPSKIFEGIGNIVSGLFEDMFSNEKNSTHSDDNIKMERETAHVNINVTDVKTVSAYPAENNPKFEDKSTKTNHGNKEAIREHDKIQIKNSNSKNSNNKDKNYHHPNNKNNKNSHEKNELDIPDISSTTTKDLYNKPKINANDTSNVSNDLRYFDSLFINQNPIIRYIFYCIIAVSVIFLAIFLFNRINKREDEMHKLDKINSINQIEDELRRMKEKNKLY